jgi:hypothetical protein
MTASEAERICEDAVAKLGEHFEAIQIMVSWTEPDGTLCVRRGGGNWYARQGMAHDFINSDKAQTEAREIAQQLDREDEL